MSGMGNFPAPNKLSSEERFIRSTSLSGSPGGFGIPSERSSPMVRSSSHGGPGGMKSGPMVSKRGEPRSDSSRIDTITQLNAAAAANLEPVALLTPGLQVAPNVGIRRSSKILPKSLTVRFVYAQQAPSHDGEVRIHFEPNRHLG